MAVAKKKPTKKSAKKKVAKKPAKKNVTKKSGKKTVRVRRVDDVGEGDSVEMGNTKNAKKRIAYLENEIGGLKDNPEVQKMKQEIQDLLNKEDKRGTRVARDGVSVQQALGQIKDYAKVVREDMRKDARDPALDYKAHIPFIGSDYCSSLTTEEMRELEGSLTREERQQQAHKASVRSFVSYYKKIIGLKNHHIRMLNEEVDILRRKTQLLEARLNENEDAVEELLVIRSLNESADKKVKQ